MTDIDWSTVPNCTGKAEVTIVGCYIEKTDDGIRITAPKGTQITLVGNRFVNDAAGYLEIIND